MGNPHRRSSVLSVRVAVGRGLLLDALQLTQYHRLALELQAVTMNFPGTGSSHRHRLWLGESVYFFEGGSRVGCMPWLAAQSGILLYLKTSLRNAGLLRALALM